MKLAHARIGWSSYSPDFSAPGDRRRFARYARERGLTFEQANVDEPYDVVLVTHHSDLPAWIDRKRRQGDKLKLIFELIDSYLAERSWSRRLMKGVGRFALGKDSRISFDFLDTLTCTCTAADAVICATPEQRQAIRQWNDNVHISFDWFSDELGPPKRDFTRSGRFRLVWEGQSTTAGHLLTIADQLRELRDSIELHVVTDPEIRRYYGWLRTPTRSLLDSLGCETYFHAWHRDTFSDHVTAADAAVIPIDASDQFGMGKPENKLVMLWKLGMPVIASATPAYKRAMNAAQLDMICAEPAEWGEKITQLLDAPSDDLRSIAAQGRGFAENAYSKQEFLKRFDDAFISLGFEI